MIASGRYTDVWDRARGNTFLAKFTVHNRRVPQYHRELLRRQYATPEQIATYNWERRRRLIHFAYAHVPYYRRSFDAYGFHPAALRTPEDFANIPLVTKDDIRANPRAFIADTVGARHLAPCTTGGSTGDPLTVYHDARVPEYVMGWRMLSWWGVSPWEHAGFVWRSIPRTFVYRMAQQAFWWPTRRVFLDASSCSLVDMQRFVSEWNRIKPALLQGYTGALCHLASFLNDRAITPHAPVAIWTTSSPLSLVQRRLLEGVFHASVYSQYGCGEVYWIAAECSAHTGLHVFSDTRHVEFVDALGMPCATDALGRVVVTDLENYASPLIRYVNGDLGRTLPVRCPCGVALPMMDYVTGRETDNIVLPDGTCIGGDYLTTIFDEIPGMIQLFRVDQHADRSLTVSVVPHRRDDQLRQALARVRCTLIEKTRHQVPVVVTVVDHIAHDRGKLRYVVSVAARARHL